MAGKVYMAEINNIPCCWANEDIRKLFNYCRCIKPSRRRQQRVLCMIGSSDQNLILLTKLAFIMYLTWWAFLLSNADAVKRHHRLQRWYACSIRRPSVISLDVKMNEENNQEFFGKRKYQSDFAKPNVLEGPIQKDKSSFLVSKELMPTFVSGACQRHQPCTKTNIYFSYDYNAKMNFIRKER